MLLPRHDMTQFIERELQQGQHLERALLGRWQDVYRRPKRQVRRLAKQRRFDLTATNPHARVAWMRTLGANLFDHLGATAPHWQPRGPVYFVTLVDKRLQDPGDEDYERWDSPEHPVLDAIIAGYKGLLFPLNYVGMIDVAPYVSADRVFGTKHFYHFHAHVLVWGIPKASLEMRIAGMRKQAKSLLAYITPARFSRVNNRDLRQVLWYCCKTPRQQYQAWRGLNGHWHQRSRPINGVNSVRVHKTIGRLTLDRLSIAGGDGLAILAGTIDDLASHRRGRQHQSVERVRA